MLAELSWYYRGTIMAESFNVTRRFFFFFFYPRGVSRYFCFIIRESESFENFCQAVI